MIDPAGFSEKAMVAAANTLMQTKGVRGVGATATKFAMAAAHDPALGTDRSVCLCAVLDWLRLVPSGLQGYNNVLDVADRIEREFTRAVTDG